MSAQVMRSTVSTFPSATSVDPRSDEAPEETRALAQRLDDLAERSLPELLDWAEEYRGNRAEAAEAVTTLLATASAWLAQGVRRAVDDGARDLERELDAFATLQECRKALAQRNANPQMVAERALFALQDAVRGR